MTNTRVYSRVITLKDYLEDNTEQSVAILAKVNTKLDEIFELIERRK